MLPFFPGNTVPAILALADGTLFQGFSIGAAGHTIGEVVFNTAMTGYQEILTDPSYSRQIVTLTYPHIGNIGINPEDVEAGKIHAAGLVIKDLPLRVSNFRATQTLSDYLKAENVVGIAGIDTRKLTRILREKGAQSGAIVTDDGDLEATRRRRWNWRNLSRPGRHGPGQGGVSQQGLRLDRNASGSWAAATASRRAPKYHVVAYDYGVKRNILRMLAARGCKVTVVAGANLGGGGAGAESGWRLPVQLAPAIRSLATTRSRRPGELIERGLPTFGICLGHQIMALASGAKTMKMKFGHHGANHPVQDLDSKQVLITSQNHGFAVDIDTLPANCRVTHVSLFDGTLQGFAPHRQAGVLLPGASGSAPGPSDIGLLVRSLHQPDGTSKKASRQISRRQRRTTRMPKRTDIKSILIIGAGPIVIGQACEFDYSGAQACKALREEGYRSSWSTRNPATIMTDPEMADVTYIEPITWQVVENIIAKRKAGCDPAHHGRPDRAELRAGPAQATACWKNTASK